MDEDLLYEISLLDILSGKIAEAEGHVVDFEEALAKTTGLIDDLAEAVGKLREASAGGDVAETTAANVRAGTSQDADSGKQSSGGVDTLAAELTLLKKAIDDVTESIDELVTEDQQLVPAINQLTEELGAFSQPIQAIVVNQNTTGNSTASPQENEKTEAGEKKDEEGLWSKTLSDETNVNNFFALPYAVGALTGTTEGVAAVEIVVGGLVALKDVVQYYGSSKENDPFKVDSLTGEITYISGAEEDALEARKQYISNSIGHPGFEGTPGISVAETPEIPLETNIEEESKWGKYTPPTEFDINKINRNPVDSFSYDQIFTKEKKQYASNSIGHPGSKGTPGISVAQIPQVPLVVTLEEEKKWGKYTPPAETDIDRKLSRHVNRLLANQVPAYEHSGGQITINIYGGLIHTFTVNTASVKESVPEIKRIVEGAIMDALKDAEIQN